MKPSWIQTFSGLRFEPMKPNPMSIMIEDVAHALSNLCRFTGHTREFYSVAQHSVICSHAIERLPEVCDYREPTLRRAVRRRFAQAALLHDATEAYLVDVPSPIKPHILGYSKIEAVVAIAVAQKFSLEPEDFEHPLVKWVDRQVLATEARDLMNKGNELWSDLLEPLPERIEPLLPAQAKALFLARFREVFA